MPESKNQNLWKSGRYWCRKIDGRTYYFGRIDRDPEGVEALKLYHEKRDAILTKRRDIPSDITDHQSFLIGSFNLLSTDKAEGCADCGIDRDGQSPAIR